MSPPHVIFHDIDPACTYREFSPPILRFEMASRMKHHHHNQSMTLNRSIHILWNNILTISLADCYNPHNCTIPFQFQTFLNQSGEFPNTSPTYCECVHYCRKKTSSSSLFLSRRECSSCSFFSGRYCRLLHSRLNEFQVHLVGQAPLVRF